MSNYRRVYINGGCYFFTVVTRDRTPLFRQTPALNRLYDSFRYTCRKKPFRMDAYVILPDHLHCIWTLPEGDNDFSTRWRLLKSFVSIGVRKQNPDWQGKIWQSRFWEHAISNENDYQRHLDYIHYTPVKHGHVRSPGEWHDSSFMGFVGNGFYDEAWGGRGPGIDIENEGGVIAGSAKPHRPDVGRIKRSGSGMGRFGYLCRVRRFTP